MRLAHWRCDGRVAPQAGPQARPQAQQAVGGKEHDGEEHATDHEVEALAVDHVDRERFNLVIGGVFLAIVLFSPDGLLGLWASLRARLQRAQAVSSSLR